MGKFKFTPLNGLEAAAIKGGGSGHTTFCSKTGDTIICNFVADIKVCVSFEASCPSGKFSSECTGSQVTITCPNDFTIIKK
jgi:hypothetical protein